MTTELTKALTNLKAGLDTGFGMTYWEVFRRNLVDDVKDAFASSSDPTDGSAWAPVHSRPGGKPLIVTGLLQSEAIRQAGVVYQIPGGLKATFVNPYYGKFHNRGTRLIMRRRFFGMSPATGLATKRALLQDIQRILSGA